MKYILLLVLISAVISIIIFYYTRQQSILRHQLLVVNSQNTKLKSKLSKYTNNKNSIKLKFIKPNTHMGIIKKESNVLIAPIDESILLHKNKIKMEVRILDKADVENVSWYYIALPVDENINSRGWVKQSDFSLFYDDSKNITKRF